MDTPASPNYSDLQKPLEHFRATTTRRVSVHPAEHAVLWIVCVHLVVLPWLLGGQRIWAQLPSLGVALVGFLVALIPRNYTEEHTGSTSFRLIMWPKLLKFPLFWLGLGLLTLTAIQGLNPAFAYTTNGKVWWMEKIAHTSWLPAGVRAPFDRWGPWRMLIIYSAVWLTVCTVWVGFTRRRTLQTFFLVLAVNGLGLAIFGLVQRVAGNGKMFWFFESPNAYFFSSFIYKNHGAAYLFLTLALTCGIAGWYYLRGLRRLEKSNPAGVFAFFATGIAVAIMISYARGMTLVMMAFLTVMVGIFIVHQLFSPSANRKPVVAIALMLIFGIFVAVGWRALNKSEAWNSTRAVEHLKAGVSGADGSLAGRELATKASLDMLGDYWLRGAGAGSFQFLFPKYQYRQPGLVNIPGGPQFWVNAHNDLVEYPIEFGLVGVLLVLGALGYLVVRLVKSFFWENPLSGTLVLGIGCVFAYAWWDFPLHNVSVLNLWWTLLVAVTMWSGFEESNLKS